MTGIGGGADSAPAVEVSSFERLLVGWQGFTDVWLMLDMAQMLLVAIGLGAVMAYHPAVRRKASSLEQLEQPKTFIMYSMVGALIALLVQENTAMGMVVFGVGGLLRFRTDVGEAKDTGRVILVTVVGFCCGLKLFVGAFFATACGYALLYILETRPINRVMIQGLDREVIGRASEAYRTLLVQHGCRILGEKKNVLKGYFTLIFHAPASMDRTAVERSMEDAVAKELRGSVDWDVA